jgi:cobalt/nickel transport system permease protein
VLLAAAVLPLVRGGAGVALAASVGAKAAVGAVSAVLLGATTSFPDLLHALERLRVPRALTLIAGMAYRYVFVVAAEAARTRTALAARGYQPRHAGRAGPLGRAVIALFLRAYERGERVHVAMLARGYGGTVRRLRPLAFTRTDAAFVAALAGTLLPLRILAEVAA